MAQRHPRDKNEEGRVHINPDSRHFAQLPGPFHTLGLLQGLETTFRTLPFSLGLQPGENHESTLAWIIHKHSTQRHKGHEDSAGGGERISCVAALKQPSTSTCTTTSTSTNTSRITLGAVIVFCF